MVVVRRSILVKEANVANAVHDPVVVAMFVTRFVLLDGKERLSPTCKAMPWMGCILGMVNVA